MVRNVLKELRLKKRLTGKEMSSKLGISAPFYTQLENGTRKLTYEMAVRIATVFNRKPDYLFYEFYKNRIDKKDS